MTHDQILKDVKNRKYSPVYFLCGEEPYYIDLLTQTIADSVLAEEEREFNQSVLYGLDTDVPQIIAESRKFPMMAEFNVVIVKEAQHLKEIELFEHYFSKPAPSTVLVIAYKDKKLDKRKAIYKLLQKTGIYYENKKLYDSKIPDWISSHLGQAGYHISVRNAQLITEFLGNDLGHISNELGKIILNLPQGASITGEVIEEHIGINKEYNSFELNTALGHRNILKANRIVNYFSQNEKKYPIQMVIGTLYAHFSKILKFHYAGGKPPAELASFLGVHPYFVKDYSLAARHYSRGKILDIIDLLHQYDLKSKGIGNSGISGGELMKELVYRILH
ncbi:MAG: DNA polymerase III subunit delta [Vicingaceae bacterium]